MKVIIAGRARRDLIEIGDAIARDDPVRADSFTAELVAMAHGLAEFPERFPLIPELAHENVRRRLHGDYLIIYQADGGKVSILRFIHGARDYVSMIGSSL